MKNRKLGSFLLISFAVLLQVVIFLAAILVTANYEVRTSNGVIYNQVTQTPHHEVALVLGTSKYTGRGYVNPYYKTRIDATVALYKARKIDKIIVSGDNGKASYDEPTDMMQSLIAQGIPATAIHRDFAGFRTFDSMLRCIHVFGQNQVLVISQPFHLERALFIGKNHHMQVSGFAANEWAYAHSPYMKGRELLARVATVLDVYFLPTQPRFYGPKITL